MASFLLRSDCCLLTLPLGSQIPAVAIRGNESNMTRKCWQCHVDIFIDLMASFPFGRVPFRYTAASNFLTRYFSDTSNIKERTPHTNRSPRQAQSLKHNHLIQAFPTALPRTLPNHESPNPHSRPRPLHPPRLRLPGQNDQLPSLRRSNLLRHPPRRLGNGRRPLRDLDATRLVR